MSKKVKVTSRGVGRPKLNVTPNYERQLLEKGFARAAFGGNTGATVQQARVRLHNTANRLGVKITTRTVKNNGRYVEAVRIS